MEIRLAIVSFLLLFEFSPCLLRFFCETTSRLSAPTRQAHDRIRHRESNSQVGTEAQAMRCGGIFDLPSL